MIEGKRIAVVMPAYNAAKTLEATVRELPALVDVKILVDDHSTDDTVRVARELRLKVLAHDRNYGYGRNQKTCYREALASGADIVVMVHPDYQYKPTLVTAMVGMIASGVYDVVLGSRILGGGALRGGMPRYKYVSNRLLTAFQNVFLGAKLSEYHTGFRGFSRKVLEELPLLENSDAFVFDNEMLVQLIQFGYRIGEISCPALYFDDASSVGFASSMRYGFGVLSTTMKYFLQRLGIARFRFLSSDGRKLGNPSEESADTVLIAEQAGEQTP
jgi:glycosyltransferase involved in cell wall biosynthesis